MEVVGTAVLLDVELELLAWEASFLIDGGMMLLLLLFPQDANLFDTDATGLNTKLPPKRLLFLGR